MDILRCHVTFCNKFVRRYPNHAKSVIDDKQPGNVIFDRISRELQNHNGDDKVNISIWLQLALTLKELHFDGKSSLVNITWIHGY